jgi:putative FmdB family regulatory protein
MPIYEYRCRKCRRRTSVLLRSYDESASIKPRCSHCGSDQLERTISRVAMLRSEEARLDNLADPSNLSGLDENDPRSVARWMRKMSAETGEDLGDEFHEVVDRLESGQDPEDVEAAMPDLGPGPLADD